MLPTAQCDEVFAKQYEWTRSWFEFTNAQTYNSNGWAIAAAFAIFIYVMKDAKDRLMVSFGTLSAAFLVMFAGATAAGWAEERDAAYKNLLQLEDTGHRLIVSQDPQNAPQGPQRTGDFGSRPLDVTIHWLMYGVAASFVVGGAIRWDSLSKRPSKG
jgi:hypothetical protein